MARRRRGRSKWPSQLIFVLLLLVGYKFFAFRHQPSLHIDFDDFIVAIIVCCVILALMAGMVLLGRNLLRQWQRDRLFKRQRNLQSLRALTWQEFEQVIGNMFARQGFQVKETGQGGADGGIDLCLKQRGRTYLVQCKRWNQGTVGAPVVREIFGLMTHHKAAGVKIVTTGKFSKEAMAFAQHKAIELIDGQQLASYIAGRIH